MNQVTRLKTLETIFDHFPDGILLVDAERDYAVAQINPVASQILNLSREALLGKSLRSHLPEKHAPVLQTVLETFEQNRPIRNFNIEIEAAPELRKTFLVNTVPYTDPQTGRKQIMLILHDISEVSRLHVTDPSDRFETLIGRTATMRKVFGLIDTVAPTDAAILINGETGTGKELVARAIHQRSSRAKGAFIPVHCSALTSSLLESDLFGHVRGAFTGSIKDKPGRFEMADGGTIFLDEIATLSQEIQINLLRVLQEKTVERVGDTKSIKVDVRVISATNRSLPDLIRQGLFRKDLYYRIKVIQINIPPLRKRRSDIPVLVKHFIQRFNRMHDKSILGVTPETMRMLKGYAWPGNVRELENAIEHAVVISESKMIEEASLPEDVLKAEYTPLSENTSKSTATDERKIRRTLSESGGNITRSAEKLGIHRTTLWRKMRELNIPRFPET